MYSRIPCLEYSRIQSALGPGAAGPPGRVARTLPAAEHDPLQAQYDGIPVPCYTWRRDGDGFLLERANRAAFEQAGGRLEPLLGRRAADVYADRPDIAQDMADAVASRTTVRREMEHTLATTG